MPSQAGDLPKAVIAQPRVDIEGLKLLFSADASSIKGIRKALEQGADINYVHPETGLSALHIAIGNNDIFLCRFLIEECGAGFFPDPFSRWPTLLAAECRVSDELSDYIVEQEERYMERNPPPESGKAKDSEPGASQTP